MRVHARVRRKVDGGSLGPSEDLIHSLLSPPPAPPGRDMVDMANNEADAGGLQGGCGGRRGGVWGGRESLNVSSFA